MPEHGKVLDTAVRGLAVRRTGSYVVVHVPHAGLVLPAELQLPTVADLDDEVHLMADLGVNLVADALDAAITAAGETAPNRITNTVSRLVMDPERFDGPDEEMNDVGMGVVYTHTHDGRPLYDPPLTPAETERRKHDYYQPYSRAFADLVDDVLAQHDRCLIIDLHSYATEPLAFERHQADRRPPVVSQPRDESGAGRSEAATPDIRRRAGWCGRADSLRSTGQWSTTRCRSCVRAGSRS